MAQFDLPLTELQDYRPEREEQPNWDHFWRSTLAAARADGGTAVFEPVDTLLTQLVVEDVTFPGFDGDPVKGWLVRPAKTTGRLPLIVQFVGYTGGRGLPIQWTTWPSAGYACFVMDNRGQGNGGWRAATPDPHGSGPQSPGRMSSGIESPDTYYFRRLFTDAVRALDAVRSHPCVDAERIIIRGGSQGGAIALAAAALGGPLAGVMVDVPFLSHFRRALRITDAHPYHELADYLQTRRGEEDRVFRVLSYFDGVNFAARASAPALFSVGLTDQVSPPSTVFAAFNHYAGEKEIRVYPYNGHEGGQEDHNVAALEFAARIFS